VRKFEPVINIRTEFSCGLTKKYIVEKSNIQWVREGRTKQLNLQHKDNKQYKTDKIMK
jgi:hypothetical protein